MSGLLDEHTVTTKQLFSNHKLPRLLPPFQLIFDETRWSLENTKLESAADFDELIVSLDKIDPNSYAFRYPIGKKSEALLGKHTVMNPVLVAGYLEPLFAVLEQMAEDLREGLEITAPKRQKLQEWLSC